MEALASRTRSGWETELRDAIRAMAGGMLFGIPLLYTQEVWDIGGASRPIHGAGVLGLTAVVVFTLNRTAGFRSVRDMRTSDALMDTVEALAIGIVSVLLVLVVLDEVTSSTPVGVALGKVLYQSLPFCLGVGLARHFLQDAKVDDAGGRAAGTGGDDRTAGLNPTLSDLGLTFLGAVFVGLNIAPTEEVTALAAAMGPARLLALVVLSLAVSYAIVFVAGLSGEDRRRAQGGVLQRPVAETIFSYLVALTAATLMLLLFRQLEGPWTVALGNIVALGLPAAVGGAAGRLAL